VFGFFQKIIDKWLAEAARELGGDGI